MLLADKTIKEYIRLAYIKILPAFDDVNIRSAGVRIHLGDDLLVPIKNKRIDPQKIQSVDDCYGRRTLDRSYHQLAPNEFVLGSTYEKILLPRNIIGFVDGRSTLARLGLSIHCSAAVIDGNYEEPRAIVLEIKNVGPFELILTRRMPIGQLLFQMLSDSIEQPASMHYSGQINTQPPNLLFRRTPA